MNLASPSYEHLPRCLAAEEAKSKVWTFVGCTNTEEGPMVLSENIEFAAGVSA
jgi:hypothetical protein